MNIQQLIAEIIFIETGLIVFDSTGSEVDKRFAAIMSMSADRIAAKLVAELGLAREVGYNNSFEPNQTRYVTDWMPDEDHH